jgi:hypothetical protein
MRGYEPLSRSRRRHWMRFRPTIFDAALSTLLEMTGGRTLTKAPRYLPSKVAFNSDFVTLYSKIFS